MLKETFINYELLFDFATGAPYVHERFSGLTLYRIFFPLPLLFELLVRLAIPVYEVLPIFFILQSIRPSIFTR